VGDIECGDVGGANCGDCSDHGAGWVCEANTCVDACAEAECGAVDGVDCGDCSAYGDGFACNGNACVEACAGAECGTILGVECGECALDLECGENHTCGPPELDGAVWIAVPSATEAFGCLASLDPSCAEDEARHVVTVSSFWILATEVTAEMYAACVEDGACDPSHVTASDETCNYGVMGREHHPINCIDWAGMREYCAFAGGDLPTEAQWELAMRGAHDGVGEAYWIYPWGNTPEPSCDVAVMNDGTAGCGLLQTDEVGTKPATGSGLFNMACNVSEWTRDLYGAQLGGCDTYPCTDPDGPADGDERVLRGGNWNDFYASAFRTAARASRDPASSSPAVGGRCVIPM